MGLSGPKKRSKLSSDPNNTSWSKSTDSFGHKILSAHGWKPGQLLGAENAAHAEHFTAANASHIRVMLREDNLGLGAQLGKGNAETFGLSTLSGIFGRLNGKSDADVEKMQSAQRDVELRTYQTRKFGQMTFVRGGLLVGDKMEEGDIPGAPPQASKGESQSQDVVAVREKRKHNGDIEHQAVPKKMKKMAALNETKLRSNAEEQPDIESDATTNDTGSPAATVANDRKAAKAARKAERAEKRARKEERRKRKEERAARRDERRKSSTAVETTDIKPTATTSSRSAFRQRFMQQKRLASMDARALNEILMLKTAIV